MAQQTNPNDPYDPKFQQPELRDPVRLDDELQADPQLAEGPASGARIALIAIAIAVVLGGVFYGLNNTSTTPGQPTTSVTESSPPAAPPGMRDVTPRTNSTPGMTTGSAPAQPAPAAAPSAPAGESAR